MKMMKKLLALLLCFAVFCSFIPVTTHAKSDVPNITLTLSKTELEPGDTFTATIATKEMNVSSFVTGLDFDKELLEVTKISTVTWVYYDEENDEDVYKSPEKSSKAQANESGHVGVTYVMSIEMEHEAYPKLVVVNFKVKDNATGTTEITCFEDSAGPDGFYAKPVLASETKTVTIAGASEPECTHENKKAVSNKDGSTHKIVCDDCGETVTAKEDCSGGTATCTAKAKCEKCEAEYGSLVGHTYGELIPAKEAVHTKTELKGAVAAHYFCDACDTYFDENKAETTLAALTGAAPTHTAGADATCDEPQTCTVCRLVMKEAAGHSYGELIPAKEAVHTKTELKGAVAAHYFCDACDTYFDENKAETTLAALTGAAPIHTPGADATCDEPQTCTVCRLVMKEAAGHSYGELIPAKEAVHTQDKLEPAVAAHYYCAVCETYFDADKNETTLAALTGETPKHTVKESMTETETIKEPTCTKEGTEVVATFCACGHAFDTFERPIPVNLDACIWGEPIYGWTADGSAYAANRVCEENNEHRQAARATVTSEKIKSETCGAAGQTKYTATFDVDWAETQEWIEDLPDATGNHTYDNDCDAECNVCHAIREVEGHVYDNACDNECNVCHEIREVPDHVSDQAPCKDGKCVNCGIDMPATEDHEGIYNFSPGMYEEDTDEYTYILIFECTVCGTQVDTEYAHAKGVVTKEADCVTNPVTKYTFDFSGVELLKGFVLDDETLEPEQHTWNEETKVLTYTVVGAKDPNKHPEGAVHPVHYVNNGDFTHDLYYYCTACGEVLDLFKDNHPCFDEYVNGSTVEGADGKCDGCSAMMPVTITIHYPAVGSNEAKTETKTYPYNTKVALSSAAPAEGYDFVGYATDEAGENIVASVENNCEYTFTEDGAELYAIYKANRFTLKVTDMKSVVHKFDVPSGTNILEFLNKQDKLDLDDVINNDNCKIGVDYFAYWKYVENGDRVPEDAVMTGDLEIYAGITYTGWYSSDGGNSWLYDSAVGDQFLTGWNYIEEDFDEVEGGAWYYFDEETSVRAEGLKRAPYPTEAIEGNTYGPNAEDIAYAVSKGKDYINKESAMFLFDGDGKFMHFYTGTVDDVHYAVNGMLDMHVGMVKENEDYYYFLGDDELGMNVMQTGFVYATRNCNSDKPVGNDCVYYFGEDGKLVAYEGIAKVEGTLYYFDKDNKLDLGAGLVKVEDEYIYVRSSGKLVVNAKYYIPANDLGIVVGLYQFDENGFMIQPETTDKNGIVAENGGLFFYENGKLAYNKGLFEYEGHVIYVRSNGQLAVGEYYVTTLTNYTGTDVKSGDKVTFDENGFMQAPKNGIVDGKYYVDGELAYNAGIVEIEEGKYIYVRSNGEVVMGQAYWTTNVGESGIAAKKYTFDENGILQNPEFTADLKNGIVEENGGLYYYVDGKLAYAAGVVKLDDGAYIYVRSNGQLATGSYWATNTNGELDAKLYNWGTDGKLYI